MNPPVILMVEDTDLDVYILRLDLLRRGLTCDLRYLPDGEEAIAYLSGANQYADRDNYPQPTVTVLDCRLPGRSGLDVLAWVRRQAALKDLKIVVLTGNPMPQDRKRAEELGAPYFVKTPDNAELIDFLVPLLPATQAEEAA